MVVGVPQLSREEVEELRQCLIGHRRRLVLDISRLQNSMSLTSPAGDAGGYMLGGPNRGGRRAWEQMISLSSIASKRSLLHEIDHALHRIEDHTYGLCEETHRAIPLSRLREIPWARLA